MVRWLALLALTGCASLDATARDTFVHEATCPAGRVSVKNEPPAPAPEEIAGDPGRLALWNADAAEKARHHFVASGCGEEHHYVCDTRSDGSSSWLECTRVPEGIRGAIEKLLTR